MTRPAARSFLWLALCAIVPSKTEGSPALSTQALQPQVLTGEALDEEGAGGVGVKVVKIDGRDGTASVLAQDQSDFGGRYTLQLTAPPALLPSERLYVYYEKPRFRQVVHPLTFERVTLRPVLLPVLSPDRKDLRETITGIVKTEGGAPLQGVTLSVVLVDFENFSVAPYLAPGSNQIPLATTDLEGRFSLSLGRSVPEPSHEKVGLQLRAFQKGFAPLTVPLVPGRAESLQLTMSRSVLRLGGFVVDQHGLPSPGADLIGLSISRQSTVFAETASDEQGGFSLELPASGVRYLLLARPKAGAPTLVEVLPSPSPFILRLNAGRQLRGVVRDETTDQPLAGCAIKVSYAVGGFPLTAETTTNDQGTYVIESIPTLATIYGVTMEKAGYSTIASPIDESADGNTIPLIRLPRALDLVVRFLSPMLKPVSGVRLTLEEARPHEPTKKIIDHFVADSTARFAVRMGTYLLTATTDQFPAFSATFEVTQAQTIDVHFVSQASIRGRLLWSDLTAASDLRLRLLPIIDRDANGVERIGDDQREMSTDDDGFFALDRLHGGLYRFQIIDNALIGNVDPTESLGNIVDLPEGATLDGLTYFLERPVAVVLDLSDGGDQLSARAKVTQLNDQGETFTEFRPRTITFQGAKARIGRLVPARYRIQVELDDDEHVVEPVDVDLRQAHSTIEVKMTISAGRELRGLVMDEGGLPVAAAEAFLWKAARSSTPNFLPTSTSLFLRHVKSDDTGKFVIGGLSSGSYSLLVSKASSTSTFLPVQVSRIGSGSIDVHVVLPGGFPVEVVIRQRNGEPLDSFIANLIRRDIVPGVSNEFRGIQLPCTTIAGGCRFEAVVPGRYILRVVPLAKSAESGAPHATEIPLFIESQKSFAVVVQQ